MNGWNTKHKEFTLAKGDPAIIQQLITQFQLEEIILFEKQNNLIITTLQHSNHIRLSDLLILNQKHKVIAFTLRQYLQVIKELFQLIHMMKISQILHGDLKMENILLDLTHSYTKLDNKPTEITFQIKLINFAQFYNLEMQHDLDKFYTIYSQISEYFPNHMKQLNIQNLVAIQTDELIIGYIQELIDKFSQSGDVKLVKYSWHSNIITNFINNYKPNLSPNQNYNSINELIIQLHQYHLIVNHYPKLNCYFPSPLIKKVLPQQSEPQNLIIACLYLSNILDLKNIIGPIKLQNIEKLVGKTTIANAIKTLKDQIEIRLTNYLKINGYLQNINKFVEIVQNIEQINQVVNQYFVTIVIQFSKIEVLGLPNEILTPYIKSKIIFKKIVLLKFYNFKIKKEDQLKFQGNQNTLFQLYVTNTKTLLLQSLNSIIKIGQQNSQPLIDHIILSFGKQIKEQNLTKLDYLNNFLVQSWLSWIDQYIFDQKFNKLQQLNSINKEIFIQFVKEQGFQILCDELKKSIVIIVEEIFQKLII